MRPDKSIGKLSKADMTAICIVKYSKLVEDKSIRYELEKHTVKTKIWTVHLDLPIDVQKK